MKNVGVLLLLFSSLASPAVADGVRLPLFSGTDLNGWQVTDCQVSAEDGLLVIQEGDGFLRSNHRYRDFVLELECRARRDKGWDSGIYFRCDPPPAGRPWPKRYQINLKQGDEGNLVGMPDARSTGLVRPGEWNRFELHVAGDTAALRINGQAAWQTAGIEQREGYVGLQVEVPAGGQFEFRNLFVTELDHRPLFNGQDLAGWEGGGQDAALCWGAAEGLLFCTGAKGPWLRSLEEFDDFNLRLEYKLKPGGNSGIYLRVAEDGSHRDPGEGVEIQVLDDSAERYRTLQPYQYTGSVYAIAAAEQHVGREPGQWNSLEIDCRGHRYRVWHNGVLIVEADAGAYPQLNERRLSGFLGLQNHSEEVWYRNLRLGPPME